MKRVLILAVSAFFLVATSVRAISEDSSKTLTSFQTVLEIPDLNLATPKVVEISFPGSVSHTEISIVNATTNIPEAQTTSSILSGPEYQITTSEGLGRLLQDNSDTTYVDFVVPTLSGASSQGTINYKFDSPSNLSGINLEFGQYSQKPTYVTVVAKNSQGSDSIVLARSRFTSDRLQFPEKTVTDISVILEFDQPLRITESSIIQRGTTVKEMLVRFLAKPGQTYHVFTSPDASVNSVNPPAGSLFLEDQVIKYQSSQLVSISNPSFKARDTDADSVSDSVDNCVTVSNRDQSDTDSDGVGDACEDTDYDGIIDSKDNCPEDSNYNQRDIDADGMGDVCDSQESRFTEQYPWLPWVAMGGAATVIIVLVTMMVKNSEFKFDNSRKDSDDENSEPTE